MIDSPDIASVLAPVPIVDFMITSTTVSPEDASQIYDPARTYGIGEYAYSDVTHRRYESLKAGNLNHDPTLIENQTTATGVGTWWADVAPTNRYAMFDTLVSTATVFTSPLTVVLKPGSFNGLALFGIDAEGISITVKDAPGGNVTFSYTGDLEGSDPPDYYEYFFDRFKPQTKFIQTGLLPYNQQELTLTLTKATGNVSLGMLALGDMRPLGAPLRGATVEPIDNSSVVSDGFGGLKIKRRASATGLSISAKMTIEDAEAVLGTVQQLLGTPVVVVGSTARFYEGLTVFGLISGRQSFDDFEEPVLNLTVKGMI